MNPGKNKGCGKRRLRGIADKHGIPEDEIRAMARFDPTETDKFLDWIAGQAVSGEVSFPSDGPEMKSVLNGFRRKSRLIGQPDINGWTFPRLRERLAATESRGEAKRLKVEEGQDVIHDEPPWRVISITTPEAASKLCRPEWCIKDAKHWKTYGCGSDNPAYLVLRDGLKYTCIVPHKGELKNVKNKPLKPTKMFARILGKLMPRMSVAWISDFLGFEHLLRPIGEIMADPESAYRYARFTVKGRWPEGEPAIATNPRWAYHYAHDVVKGRWPEGEPIISTNPELAYHYAYDVIKGRWPEGEPIISTNPDWAYHYAYNVIKGRWPKAESTIATDSRWASYYANNVINGRWPEAEPIISTNPEQAYHYARKVIKGRWPEGESAIATDSRWAAYYASNVIKGRWPAVEPAIAANPEWAYHYAHNPIKGRWPEGEPAIAANPEWAYHYARNVIKGRWPEGEPAIVKLSPWHREQYAALSGHPDWADKHLPATRTPKSDTPAPNSA